ncbi:LysE family translocator [Pantoea ananatis]|uniref:LysE family translocator n=1 Tax=Pantoea ananas TaxID=553 RepID=UPI001B30684D|nr:LysE family transporter [Pantoea ananatis]
MFEIITAAFTFGLVAGLKPGPLGIIVIQQTLSRGLSSGVLASLSPILSDTPIIILAIIILRNFSNIDIFIALISLTGGLNLLWISIKLLKVNMNKFSDNNLSSSSLLMAVKINLLNPTPYLFWFTIGGSYIISGTFMESILFSFVSVASLILSKIFVALLALYFKGFLSSNRYLYVMRTLSLVLFIFGFQLIYRSLELTHSILSIKT